MTPPPFAAARLLLGKPERRMLALPERGVEIALLDWGGAGPLALLHHANGFCKGSWARVAARLSSEFRVVAMDARGHGDSSRPEGPAAYAWENFALDLLAVAERLALEAGEAALPLGVGHSFGGTSFLGAAARRPELFERLVLVDPVTPPPRELQPPERLAHVSNLVEGAQRRRSHWPSREEARAWFAERSLFADFEPEALDLYVLDGLRERPGGGVELKCPGSVEAAVFSGGGEVDVFSLAEGLAMPTLFLRARTGSFPLPFYQRIAAGMQAAQLDEIDAGHLVPMERPGLLSDAIRCFAEEGGEP